MDAISRREKMTLKNTEIELKDPAAAAITLTKALLNQQPPRLNCTLQGPFGSIILELQKITS